MCWQCDNPDKTMDDYLEMVRRTIDEYGWFVQVVERDGRRPGFAYTVGLSEHLLPELLVTGLSMRRAGALLNDVAHHLVCHMGDDLVPGQSWTQRGGPTLEVVTVAEPTVHALTAVELYGLDVEAQQLVYADDRGRWPWEVGFRGTQPVLGPRAIAA